MTNLKAPKGYQIYLAENDDTPPIIAKRLGGVEPDKLAKEIVKQNKQHNKALKGLNLRSKLEEGTTILVPEKLLEAYLKKTTLLLLK